MTLRLHTCRERGPSIARRAILLAALLASASARPSPGATSPHSVASLLRAELPATPTRVTLITIDALRADFLSFAGHGARTSPFLDSLAASSVTFAEAFANCSWTTPSLASLLTSLEPSAHGLVRPALDPASGKQINQLALAPSLVTLAETFSGAGWLTIGVPANLHLRQGSGFEQGFDHYYGAAAFQDCDPLNRIVLAQVQTAFRGRAGNAARDRGVFLWVHYFDPHDPYHAREPWIASFAPGWPADRALYPTELAMKKLRAQYPHSDPLTVQRLRRLYESEIRATDEGLRELCRGLDLADEDALLVVAADHGEEFGERGGFGHMTTLHREQVHVPLIVRWPRMLRPGRVESPVSLMDVYPTLVELLGLPDPGTLRGRSLVPLLQGKEPEAPRPLVAELHLSSQVLTSVRLGEWRLIWDSGVKGSGKLYNVSKDTAETADLASERADVARALRETMTRWREGLPPLPADLKDSPITDPELIERLRSLGYIR